MAANDHVFVGALAPTQLADDVGRFDVGFEVGVHLEPYGDAAAAVGHALEPIFAPIGFNWQMVIALVPGMAAREVAVAALGTVYAVADPESATSLLGATLAAQWSLATGLAFLAWYVFAPQCVATLGVVKRELNSWKWMWVMVVYMFGLAYLAAWIVYRIALAMGGG